MKLEFFILAFALAVSACSVGGPGWPAPGTGLAGSGSEVELEFLTRDGCRNTPVMLENLRSAIASGQIRARLRVIQQGTLPPADPRNGYPTPTVLLTGRDVFGLEVPRAPFPEPS